MVDVVLCFQAHQPRRLRRLGPGCRPTECDYFDDALDRAMLERVAERCYLPAGRVLLETIAHGQGRFRCALSLSGSLLEQLRTWMPEVLAVFVALAETGQVEFLCETSHRSFASLVDPDEFAAQVAAHRRLVADLFGEPTTFRNTDLILDNSIARRVEDLGFSCMLGEGDQGLLAWRSPHVPYRLRGCRSLQVLLRNHTLSDDVALRFSDPGWAHWPLRADTFARWLHEASQPAECIGLFMDYETLGEHQSASSGVFEFLRHLPREVLRDPGFRFRTPAQVVRDHEVVAELDVPAPVTWAGTSCMAETSATKSLIGNPMQATAHAAVWALRAPVLRLAEARPDLLEAWRRLSASDHLHYAATGRDGGRPDLDHGNPLPSPHAAFVALMTALDDLREQVARALKKHGI